MDVNDKLHQLTTIIEVQTKGRLGQGSGFIYAGFEPDGQEGQGTRWRRIEDIWVATNRHVLLPRVSGKEILPDKITLHLRRIDDNNELQWIEVPLTGQQIEDKTRFHADTNIDVALVSIYDYFVSEHQRKRLTAPFMLTAEHQPGRDGHPQVNVGDDVLVVGYPRGFYDDVNLFPIVKAGIIASRWGAPFQGKPYFLIDAKLFPGSSGSVVVTKPIDMTIKNGQLMVSKEKQFSLLGIYSGEPFHEEPPVEIGDLTVTAKSRFDVGIVWYADTIEETRQRGIGIREAMTNQ